jgi:hypothetical protein
MTNGNVTPKPEILWVILSIFFPVLGFILTLVYMSKPEPEAKAFGKNCLIFTLVGMLMATLGCVFLLAVGVFVC